MSLTAMTTYHWDISAIGCAEPIRAGTASTLIETWTAALHAGRAALLAGDLQELAVYVDGQLEAQISPGRDGTGSIDPAALTGSLVEIHQAATAHLIAELIARPPIQP